MRSGQNPIQAAVEITPQEFEDCLYMVACWRVLGNDLTPEMAELIKLDRELYHKKVEEARKIKQKLAALSCHFEQHLSSTAHRSNRRYRDSQVPHREVAYVGGSR